MAGGWGIAAHQPIMKARTHENNFKRNVNGTTYHRRARKNMEVVKR